MLKIVREEFQKSYINNIKEDKKVLENNINEIKKCKRVIRKEF